jgi:Tfp pilus assembly protein FimT
MRNRAAHVRNSKGFSITELIIIMAFIGIFVAIAAPSITSQITHLRLTRSVRNVVSELNAARFKAIAKNTRYQVEFTLNSGATPPDSYQLQSWNGASYVDEPGRAEGQLEDGISITSPGATFDVEFYPNGAASATTICIDNTKKTNDRMKITVRSATGMIQVETGC